MATPNTRMTNRKPIDTVGHPHDDGHKQQQAEQTHRTPQQTADAIDAAEHGRDKQPAAKPGQQR